jgi:DJ-1/PfpI family protein
VTSYHSIKTDLRNAGADWVDQELVEAVSDAGGVIITSRHPGDLPACCDALLRQLKERNTGRQAGGRWRSRLGSATRVNAVITAPAGIRRAREVQKLSGAIDRDWTAAIGAARLWFSSPARLAASGATATPPS